MLFPYDLKIIVVEDIFMVYEANWQLDSYIDLW